jgi:hypothetical protein
VVKVKNKNQLLIGKHLAFIGCDVVGAVEIDVDRVDDGKRAMASPRAGRSARRGVPDVASRSQRGPGRSGVDTGVVFYLT